MLRSGRLWVGIGILAVTVIVWIVGRTSEDASPSGGTGRDGVRGSNQAPPDVPTAGVDVHLELIERGRTEAPATERNLFRFRDRPQAVAQVPAPVAQAGRGVVPPAVAVEPQAALTIPLRFIGVVEAPNQVSGKVAVLSDGRGNVFYGREGDIVDGRYRMLGIGLDSAEIAYADGRGRQTIRLTGQ